MLIDGRQIEIVELDGSPFRRLVLDPAKDDRRIEETAEHRRHMDDQPRRDYPDRYSEA